MASITAAEIEPRLGWEDCLGVYTVLFEVDQHAEPTGMYGSVGAILKTLKLCR